eukprot:symbB.v1.2.040988.t1/scaffold7488.1/size10961/1
MLFRFEQVQEERLVKVGSRNFGKFLSPGIAQACSAEVSEDSKLLQEIQENSVTFDEGDGGVQDHLSLTLGAFFDSCPMLEVLSAVTGESIALFEELDFAEGSVKALKQCLARKIGVPRFRLQILQLNCPLDDNQILIENQTWTLQVVQLVVLEFQLPDREQDEGIMVACKKNDDKLLERHLNQPRNPNFEDANAMTPLCAASLNGSLKCASLLIEAGANQDQGTHAGATPLLIAAMEGHLEFVQFLV